MTLTMMKVNVNVIDEICHIGIYDESESSESMMKAKDDESECDR